MRTRPLPGGSSILGPISAMITSCRNERTRLTFGPREQRAHGRDEAIAEFGIPQRQQQRRQPQTQFLDRCLTQRPKTDIGSIGMLDRRGEEVFLGSEIVVHQCGVHAGVGGDGADRGLTIPLRANSSRALSRIRSRVSETPAGVPAASVRPLSSTGYGVRPPQGRRGQAQRHHRERDDDRRCRAPRSTSTPGVLPTCCSASSA